MMELLKPLGLLGLLSIVVLIIIYIIRPNFQQKLISSTFVWRLSLKYKKKRLPISKLRNILIIVCQILILAASALILTEPVKNLSQEEYATEVIAIIDASASMRASTEKTTRFETAVNRVADLSDRTLANNGTVSIILAESNAEYLIQRSTIENKDTIKSTLDSLVSNTFGDIACSYGDADIEGAMALCERVLEENPSAMVYLYTDTTYDYVPTGVQVENVSQEGEWNMAILSASAELEENYYAFYVDVACYGRNTKVNVELQVQDANAQDSMDKGTKIRLVAEDVECNDDQTKRIVFINADNFQGSETESDDVVYVLIENKDQQVFAYQSIHISIENALSNEKDSFLEDNGFSIYNGQKEVVKIQYASSLPNPWVPNALSVLKQYYMDRWDLQITEVKKGGEFATEGFNFYIFEHSMPEKLPTDGVVLLLDPLSNPSGVGFRAEKIHNYGNQNINLVQGETHEILNNIDVDAITVSSFVEATYDDTYKALMYCDGRPVLTVKNDEDAKIAVMAFSLHYSNLAILPEFPLLINNIFNHFYPSTVSKDAFEVGEKIELNARGEALNVLRDGASEEETLTFTEFPSVLEVSLPGTYTMTQTTFGNKVKESIFVTIPMSESNIWGKEDLLTEPYRMQDDAIVNKDLLLYLATALVAILFLEWLLQIRNNM